MSSSFIFLFVVTVACNFFILFHCIRLSMTFNWFYFELTRLLNSFFLCDLIMLV